MVFRVRYFLRVILYVLFHACYSCVSSKMSQYGGTTRRHSTILQRNVTVRRHNTHANPTCANQKADHRATK